MAKRIVGYDSNGPIYADDGSGDASTTPATTDTTADTTTGDQDAAISNIISGKATTGGQTTTDATAGTTTTTGADGTKTTTASTTGEPPTTDYKDLTPEQQAQFQQAMGNFGGMFLPPGEGPRQQDPDNQVMAPIDPNANPGDVGSAYNSDGTLRDTPEQVAAKTAAAMAPTDAGGSSSGSGGSGGGGGGDKKEETKAPAIVAPTYEAQGGAMLKGAEDSYGANATETLQKAMGAGAQFGNMAAAEGGRNATGYARASGLSPAQAALMAGQGAEGAYNTGLGQGVDKYMGAASAMGNLGLGEQGQGLQKYGIDMGKYATDVGADTARYGIDKNVGQQDKSNWMNLLGAGASALAPFLSFLKDGTDSADGGLTVVGEAGPELVNMPKGAQVIPNHALRGYDLLASITKGSSKKSEPAESSAPAQKDTPKVSDYVQLSQKLDKVFDYLKAAK